MNQFHVTERFVSINGEARRAGELSCFVRFAGCNLCCNYCDTRWSCDPEAECELLTAEELHTWIRDCGVTNVTLTGGEPLLAPGIEKLLRELGQDGALRIEVETNGAVSLRSVIDIPGNISYTMDLKCPGSGMAEHMLWENYELLRPEDTVKCVVSDRQDLDWVRDKLEERHLIGTSKQTDHAMVYISPVFGRIHPKEIVDYMKEYKMNDVRLQLQLHKYIWNPEKRGV